MNQQTNEVINRRFEEQNQRCLKAVEWLLRRHIAVARASISLEHVHIHLAHKPNCDLKNTQVILREGSRKGEVLHLSAPLNGCEIRWKESLH